MKKKNLHVVIVNPVGGCNNREIHPANSIKDELCSPSIQEFSHLSKSQVSFVRMESQIVSDIDKDSHVFEHSNACTGARQPKSHTCIS